MEASDRYRIGRRIGGGGMAEVFEAEAVGERGFSRRVALKRLREELLDEGSVRSFVDEATIASRLHHANIVSVLDFGLSDGRPFIVMELVDGVDLSELENLAQLRRRPLSPELALHVGVEVCRALDHAHRATEGGRPLGIVHRDVSPENILIGYNGEVKLADFGIAFAHERLEATRVGVVKGKLEFLAPEQLRMGEVDGRADLFSLGIVLHRLLTAENPMARPETRQRVVAGEAVPLSPALPSELRAVLERATRSMPRQRFTSASEFGQALFTLFSERTNRDGPSLLADWLASTRSSSSDPAPGGNPFEDLMNVELVLAGGAGPVRSFTQVESRPHEVNAAEPTVISTSVGRATSAEDVATVMLPARRSEPATSLPTPPADPLIGVEVHGHRIEALIGTGATARVYRAVHAVLDREVAVKVLHGPQAHEERAFERLRREAKALVRAGHPNVVGVLDFGITPLGQPFLTTELLRGRTLRQRVLEDGPLSPEAAAELVHQIAAGLIAAHNAGVVHRDLKPSNVFLVPGSGGELVKLLDFGVARVTLGEGDMTRLTRPDQMLGTPKFMAPEQIRGAAEVGPSADLYALGAVLYFMLSGRAPFEGSAAEVVHQHLSAAPPRLTDRRGLERLAARLLEKDPSARLGSAEGVLEELVRLGFPPPKIAPDPITVGSSTITEERTSPRARRPKLGWLDGLPSGARWVVAGSLSIAVLSLLALLILGRGGPTPAQVTVQATRPTPTISAIPAATPPEAEPEAPEPLPPGEATDTPEPGRGVRASKRPARGAEDSAALERARKRLARIAATHGTTEARLQRDPLTQEAYQRYDRSLKSRDAAAAEEALSAMEARLSALEIDEDRLNDRLRKLSAELQRVPKGSLGDLEDRYLEVRASLRPRMKPEELKALAARLGSLERDVRRAVP